MNFIRYPKLSNSKLKSMSTNLKQLIALLVTVFALGLLYTSAYLPYAKSSLYIAAMQGAGGATTLEDFLKPYDTAFNFWSPVGQPEMIRFFANNVLSFLTDQKQSLPEPIATALVNYTVDRIDADTLGNKGLNYTQLVLLEASILSSYGEKYNKPDALQKAEDLYKEGENLSPRRPQFLYGLFSLYAYENKPNEARPIGEEILKYWPQDTTVSNALANLK